VFRRRRAPGLIVSASRAIDAVNDRLRRLSAAVVAAVGEANVVTVFAGGSAARGDVAWFEGDGLEIYSDLDLYVVVADGVDATTARTAARRAARDLPGVEGVRFLRPDDVGVYTRADLYGQPARPGTAGLGSAHLVLHGDETIPAQAASRIGGAIDAREGLYLIENRILELDLAGPDPGTGAGHRLRRYVLMKSVLDVASAWLIARGRFDSSLGVRRAALDGLATAGDLPAGWDGKLVAGAFDGLADLGGTLSGPADPTVAERLGALGVSVWTAIAAAMYARSRVSDLIATRCDAGDYIANFRELLAMSAGLERPRGPMIRAGLRLSRFAPLAALRLSALAARVASRDDLDADGRRAMQGLLGFLDRLTAACGFTDGSLKDRVRAMHTAVA